MTEPAHYARGPSSAGRWLICTDSPEAQAGYPDETSDAADEGTAAHWLLEQALKSGNDAQVWVENDTEFTGADGNRAVPAGEATGCLKSWPITGEMIEGVQLHIDTVKPDIEKKGTKVFVEERVRLDQYMGLPVPVGGTADTVVYLPRSKTLKVIDFKYGRGHAVEVTCDTGKIYFQDEAGNWQEQKGPDWGVNPQLGLYALAVLAELERLIGKKVEVKNLELIVVQPRITHKKGKVRKSKLTPLKLMGLEAALVAAIHGPRVRVPGDHCFFCRAKPDCAPYLEVRSTKAMGGDTFTAEAAPGTEVATVEKAPTTPVTLVEGDSLAKVLGEPVKGLPLAVLSRLYKALPPLEQWLKEVKVEIKARLLHDLPVEGARLGVGRGSRAYGGTPEALAIAAKRTAEEVGLQVEAFYSPAELRSPAALEKELGKEKFAKTTLATMVSYTPGGPTVVDTDSEAPAYVKGQEFTAEAEKAPPVEGSAPPVVGSAPPVVGSAPPVVGSAPAVGAAKHHLL